MRFVELLKITLRVIESRSRFHCIISAGRFQRSGPFFAGKTAFISTVRDRHAVERNGSVTKDDESDWRFHCDVSCVYWIFTRCPKIIRKVQFYFAKYIYQIAFIILNLRNCFKLFSFLKYLPLYLSFNILKMNTFFYFDE